MADTCQYKTSSNNATGQVYIAAIINLYVSFKRNHKNKNKKWEQNICSNDAKTRPKKSANLILLV